MNTNKKLNNVIVIGGGISGLSLSMIFAKHGIHVTLLEKDSEIEQAQEDDRSANFTITNRGLILLEKIGIHEQVLAKSKELTHRIIHHRNQTIRQKYGGGPLDHPRSIQRSDLLCILAKKAQGIKHLNIHYNSFVTELDKKKVAVTALDSETNIKKTFNGDLIVGADGAFSTIRQQMVHGLLINTSISYFDWVYKKLVFSSSEASNLKLDLNGLHVWPRKNGILFGLPNLNGSIACIFCGKFDKMLDLQSEKASEYFLRLFNDLFPDFQNCLHLQRSFVRAKISGLVNVQISSFHYQEKVVLVGDACHAVFPFYGQGMNAALDDCLALIASLQNHNFQLNSQVFIEYDKTQKKSADALQHLSTQHFFALMNHVNSPLYEGKAWMSSFLERFFPGLWKNEYSLVVRGGVSYDQALLRMRRQNLYRWLFMIKIIEFCLLPIVIIKRWMNKIQYRWRKNYRSRN